MGWSWAVFLASAYLFDLLRAVGSPEGPLFCDDRLLVEGAPAAGAKRHSVARLLRLHRRLWR
eukprot:1098119-Lingulodinium_polyedra.AAC.1